MNLPWKNNNKNKIRMNHKQTVKHMQTSLESGGDRDRENEMTNTHRRETAGKRTRKIPYKASLVFPFIFLYFLVLAFLILKFDFFWFQQLALLRFLPWSG